MIIFLYIVFYCYIDLSAESIVFCSMSPENDKDQLGNNCVLFQAKPPVAQCGELRFADLKSKNFKVFLFEFSQAKLCYYKDKTVCLFLYNFAVNLFGNKCYYKFNQSS